MNRVTIVRLCVIAGSVLAVEALCRFGVINRLTLLPPSEMATYLLHLLVSGEINQAIVQTFSNVAIAFVLSVVLGFLVGAVTKDSQYVSCQTVHEWQLVSDNSQILE